MAKDTTAYFIVMLVTVAVFTGILRQRDSLRLLWDPMVMTLGSVACSRMIMNMHESAEEYPSVKSSVGISYELQSISHRRGHIQPPL
ncbi:hypothetical protein EXIGLDRAFT_761167 [Exidia glandulosa HHB12029]|uniref:Uncharacterized protein n=1 Tax=Exidia glandulosa HHB12029 TaxID=1314781 RepID=A0A165NSI0_EXIGL|nr:hypothetical protein EXIGLDRAFT_761167 [Exidia glandulosa HHB12029]